MLSPWRPDNRHVERFQRDARARRFAGEQVGSLRRPRHGHRLLAVVDEEARSILKKRRYDACTGEGMLLELMSSTDANVDEALLLADIKILLFIGSETSAHTLTLICYLLARHTDVLRGVCGEIDETLGDRAVQASDIARLRFGLEGRGRAGAWAPFARRAWESFRPRRDSPPK